MISINIGRTFLTAFNKKYNKSYTAKEFFETIFFEEFFNHPKYMLWHTNSPFVQMKKGQKPHLLSTEERIEKLNNLKEKIAAGERDSSIAIGFPASEEKKFRTTSGLVSDIDISSKESDVYYSWIGAGFGIGVSGGYCIFLNDPEILLSIYEGWGAYRRFLNDVTLEKLASNKINTWNGQWLTFRCSKKFKNRYDFSLLDSLGFFEHNKNGDIQINTVKWTQLFFSLSQRFSDQTIMGYVFSFGQTNKTIGFVPFHLHQAKTIIYFYRRLFGENNAIKDSRVYEDMFGTQFKSACQLGAIGLHALQPRDLRSYFNKGKKPDFKIKSDLSKKRGETEEQYLKRQHAASDKAYEKVVLFRTFKTWLVAMLTKNKEEMLDYTIDVAKALHAYRSQAKTNEHKNLIEKELLVANSKKQFINALAVVIKDILLAHLDIIRDLKERVHLMSSEDFGYFVVLLRFDYAYEERNSN